MINEITTNKKFKLAEYLKFDSQFGRDQNIDIGTTSSIAPQENQTVEAGVTLTCFAPQKRLKPYKKPEKEVWISETEVIETDVDLPQRNLTFEEKIRQREQEERDGLIAPRQAAFVKEGGKLILKNQMTKSKYQKMFGHQSRVQKIRQKLEENRKSVELQERNMEFSSI